ncbi:MAG: hypothetical protein PHC75_08635 [Burkholderiales bacterium]|nr:hypothetical protein [Burkholderiales bacterium]
MQKKIISFEYEEYESKNELNDLDKELIKHALVAVTQASAQFSHFHVGVAARLSDGSIHLGSNKENTSITNCAEQTLLLHLQATNNDFAIESIAVTFQNMNPNTTSDFPITPCGKCRQILLEDEQRSKSPMRIIMTGQSGKVFIAPSVLSMLPLAYGEDFLQHNK